MNLSHLEAIAHTQRVVYRLTPADLAAAEVVLLPPFTALRSVQTLIDADEFGLGYGAQDVSAEPCGAFTGDVSATMLAALGCSYVLVGHSERRSRHHESDGLVAAKAAAALLHRITPVICVGEDLGCRDRGAQIPTVTAMLRGSLAGLSAEQIAGSVIAYEPVWAIGTGRSATAEDAQSMAAALRGAVREDHGDATARGLRVLYGGSVTAALAATLLAGSDVDGALVGGASLAAEEFVDIVRAAGAR